MAQPRQQEHHRQPHANENGHQNGGDNGPAQLHDEGGGVAPGKGGDHTGTQVEAAAQDNEGYTHSADGDHGDLPQNVNDVGGGQELAVGKGHDHTDEDQQRPGPHLVQDQGK